jgi:hypothetical protein
MAKFSDTNQPDNRGERKPLTLEQEIAQLEKKLAMKRDALRDKRKDDMVIIGVAASAAAHNDPEARKTLLKWMEKYLTRDADKKRAESVIAELKELETAAAAPEKTAAATAGKA